MQRRTHPKYLILNPLVSLLALLMLLLGVGCATSLKARLDEGGFEIGWRNSAPTTAPVASR